MYGLFMCLQSVENLLQIMLFLLQNHCKNLIELFYLNFSTFSIPETRLKKIISI